MAGLGRIESRAPVVVFAPVALWMVYEKWGWGTGNAEQVVALLKWFDAVTVPSEQPPNNELLLKRTSMSNQPGPIEIYCDAPPTPIVKGCERLGFHSPMDVRWCRLSHLLAEQDKRQRALGLSLWRWFVSPNPLKGKTCICGEPLPRLEWYTFMFISGQFTNCRLGQCDRCRTIFWDEG